MLIKMRLAVAAMGALALSACVVDSGSGETGASTVSLTSDPAGGTRYLVSETPTAIMAKGFYLRVHQDGAHWMADFISRSPVGRRDGQDEIFYVSEDRRSWWLTTHKNMGYCSDGAFSYNAEYTVCNSEFGKFSALGQVMTLFGNGPVETGKPMSINHDQVVSAIRSIPEGNLSAIYADLLKQDAADRQGHAMAVQQEQVINERIRQREAAQLATDWSRMSKEPRGSEDTCEISHDNSYNVWCRFSNTNVPLANLPNHGWIVDHPVVDADYQITGYIIRKVK